MANLRNIEISQRAANGQFQNLPRSPYLLEQQPLVRIGSAPTPRGDLEIPNSKEHVEPLHLLLRRKNPNANSYELLNVSAQPIIVHHPTGENGLSNRQVVEPNDGAVELFDYDYVEFGRNNFLLTYQTGEWVTMDVEMLDRRLQQPGVKQYKITFRQGDVAHAQITLRRWASSPHIQPEDELDFTAEILGLEQRYFEWEVKRTNKFSGQVGGEVLYKLTCTGDCRAPGITQRIHFVVALYNKEGKKLHAVARSAIFELVPCGPFELEFGPPNQRRR